MDFYQAFDSIKAGISEVDTSKFQGNFAIQCTMTNKDCGGIFYIEYKDGSLNVEPYNYYDNNVDITAGYSDLCKALAGSVSKNVIFAGDESVFKAFAAAIKFALPEKKAAKKPAKKAAAKKTAEKKVTEKKVTEKKTEKKPEEKKPAEKIEKKTEAKPVKKAAEKPAEKPAEKKTKPTEAKSKK